METIHLRESDKILKEKGKNNNSSLITIEILIVNSNLVQTRFTIRTYSITLAGIFCGKIKEERKGQTSDCNSPVRVEFVD